jgi:hypothetical protein
MTFGENFPVLIANQGQAAVTISSITIGGKNASDFVMTNTCPIAPATLGIGASCDPGITFTPSAKGVRIAKLSVAVVGGATQTAVLVGQGLADVKALGFNVSDVSFAATALGLPPQSAPSALVVYTNTGTVPLTIKSVALTDQKNFSLSPLGCLSVLQPGEGCFVNVLFEPRSIGHHTATLVVSDDAPGGKQSLPVTGIATAATKTVQAYPPNLDFSSVVLANPQQLQVIVQNSGSESLVINNIKTTGPNAADYSIAANTCLPAPYTLAAGGQCSLQVQFIPAALGARVADLRIAYNASGSPQVVPLTGLGVAGNNSYSLCPPAVAFGVLSEGQSTQASVNVVNTGNMTLSAPSISIQGGSSDFQIATNYCSSDIAPGGLCPVSVSFTPTQTGLQTAVLVASETGTGQSVSASLAGSAVSAGVAVSATAPAFSPEPVGVISPSSFAYVSNISSSPITITGTALAGGAQADFLITQNGCAPGTVLAAGGQCAIQLTFTPSTDGARTAALSVSDSGDAAAIEIPVAGFGLTASRTVSLTPSPLDMGPVLVGGSATANPNIINTGTEAVEISHISIQGRDAADWTLTGTFCPLAPATLASGGSCYVTLQFAPLATGTRVARLQVRDDAAGTPQSIILTGFGTTNLAPPVSINPVAVNFNPQALGTSNLLPVSQ